tara:strand:- start:756 stop:1160 length:405 start_codon:yes stop_codon:yes gene_type:complete
MTFHHPGIFSELCNVISSVRANLDNSEEIPESLGSGASAGFFYANRFADSWTKILRNTPNSPDKIESAFNTWFDAFRTLKFVHFLEEKLPDKFRPQPIGEAFSELYKQFDISFPEMPLSPDGILERLRSDDLTD